MHSACSLSARRPELASARCSTRGGRTCSRTRKRVPESTTALHFPERSASACPRMIVRGHADYPGALEDLRDPPRQLWALGEPRLAHLTPIVAIVGTRNSTAYG